VRRDLLLLLAVFAIVTAIAALLGATNFGTALTFGQIAFAGALVFVLVKRP
jgi:predicted Co/Zn/Cd cation transporter (cation efflux family)